MPSQNTLNPAAQIPEPTTPQGPPPGPIPMGYLPSQAKGEETSPTAQPEVQDNNSSTLSNTAPPSQDSQVPPPPPQRKRTPPQQIPIKEQNGQVEHQEKKCEPEQKSEPTRKPSSEKAAAEDANIRKTSGHENKSTKEPVVNFIPIKVEHQEKKCEPEQKS